jgi:2-keto-4-pentenoate hydratase
VSGLADRDRYAPGFARQLARFRTAIEDGMPRRGWKVGINVPEVLKRAGLTHSGVGWVDGRRVFESGATVPAASGARLRVEPEVAIHVGAPVSATDPAEAIRAAILGVSPALELVDYALPATDFDEVVALCMFHDACVLGSPLALDALPAELGRDWPRVEVNGRLAAPPRPDLVPTDLTELVRFVATFLSEFGEALAPGDLIMSGSYCPVALPLETGDRVRADFGSLGEVCVKRA